MPSGGSFLVAMLLPVTLPRSFDFHCRVLVCSAPPSAPSWGFPSCGRVPAWSPATPRHAENSFSCLALPLLHTCSPAWGPGAYLRTPCRLQVGAARCCYLQCPDMHPHCIQGLQTLLPRLPHRASSPAESCFAFLLCAPAWSPLHTLAFPTLGATPHRAECPPDSLLFDPQALSAPISRSSCGLGLDLTWAASDCYRSCCVVDGPGIVAFTAPFTLDPCCLRWLRLLVPSLGALRFRATADQTSSPVRT